VSDSIIESITCPRKNTVLKVDQRQRIATWLAKVPKELGNVYKHISSEVIDKDDYPQTLRLMRWVCLAERPLTVEEAPFAMSLPDTEIYPAEFPGFNSELSLSDPSNDKEQLIRLSPARCVAS
jgi:hypothetical protein